MKSKKEIEERIHELKLEYNRLINKCRESNWMDEDSRARASYINEEREALRWVLRDAQ